MTTKIQTGNKGSSKETLANLVFSTALVFLALATLFFSTRQKRSDEQLKKEITESVAKEVSEVVDSKSSSDYPDYDSLQRIKKLTIVNNFESWTPHSDLEDSKIKTAIIVEKGKLTKGYVYIKASLDGKALTSWESIYLKLNNIGGHLFRPKSLPLPKSDKTELLYSLTEIPYIRQHPYSENIVPATTNWFVHFYPDSQISLDSFISSLKPAILEELSIYYDCEKDIECLLTLK